MRQGNSYTIVIPLLPALYFHVAKFTPLPASLDVNGKSGVINRTYDHLIIPDLRIDAPIGPTIAALDQGAWMRPAGSTPDKGGNTVIAGHRFAYGASTIFYNLDKLHSGAEVGLVYNAKLYRYIVDKSYIVQASQVEVEEPSSPAPKLTLYTCTPLFTAKERLVVEATLKEIL